MHSRKSNRKTKIEILNRTTKKHKKHEANNLADLCHIHIHNQVAFQQIDHEAH